MQRGHLSMPRRSSEKRVSRMRSRVLLLVLILTAVALPSAPAAGAGTCDTTVATPGGDWRRFGQDISSTRHQTAETTISAENADSLEVAWSFANGSSGGYITS